MILLGSISGDYWHLNSQCVCRIIPWLHSTLESTGHVWKQNSDNWECHSPKVCPSAPIVVAKHGGTRGWNAGALGQAASQICPSAPAICFRPRCIGGAAVNSVPVLFVRDSKAKP